MPSIEKVQNSEVMKRRMYDFLAEVVPASMRGKEGPRMMTQSGAFSISLTQYDFVSVTELNAGVPPTDKSTITVMFKRADCQKTAVQ